ncbi:hypothetical protein [Agromyces humi]|uniref:hypothetical protein n=1 Tax=Agromyces humi TaxID=1766800 RepID=UPI0013597912|nr:hypothetical protein [Agromyces humi]
MSVPLPIFGELVDGDMDLIRAAKQALDVPFLVSPRPANPELRGNLRVLAIRNRPTYLCENVLVPDPHDATALRSALAWTLRVTDTHHLALTVDEMVLPLLRGALGPGVRELIDEPAPAPATPEGKVQPRQFDGWAAASEVFANA